MKRFLHLAFCVYSTVLIACLAASATVTIYNPQAPPDDITHLAYNESLVGWGVLNPDGGSVQVKIHVAAYQEYQDEVNIAADPTDHQGNWGNNYYPADGAWDYIDANYTITVIATGSSSRGFHVDN